jgi:hypothetical protein
VLNVAVGKAIHRCQAFGFFRARTFHSKTLATLPQLPLGFSCLVGDYSHFGTKRRNSEAAPNRASVSACNVKNCLQRDGSSLPPLEAAPRS